MMLVILGAARCKMVTQGTGVLAGEAMLRLVVPGILAGNVSALVLLGLLSSPPPKAFRVETLGKVSGR